MPLNIYETSQFKPTNVGFQPNFGVREFDLKELNDLGKDAIKIEDNRLTSIEDNYAALQDVKDEATGLSAGFKYGDDTIKAKLRGAGIEGKDFFNMSMDQLQDPFLARDKKSRLNSVMNDPEIKDVLLEGEHLKGIVRAEKKLARKSPGLANALKQRILAVKAGIPGKNGIIPDAYGIDLNDFREINPVGAVQEVFDGLKGDIEWVERPGAPGGYVIMDKVSKTPIGREQFKDMLLNKFGDSELFKNNLRSQIDYRKKSGDRTLGDKEAMDAWLDGAIDKVWSNEQQLDSRLKIDRTYAKPPTKTSESKKDNFVGVSKAKSLWGLKEQANAMYNQLQNTGIPINGEVINTLNKKAIEEGIEVLTSDDIIALQKQYAPKPTVAQPSNNKVIVENIIGKNKFSSQVDSHAGRNNNPLNLRPPGASKGFQKFDSLNEGLQAAIDDMTYKFKNKSKNLISKYGENYMDTLTLEQFIENWSPQADNPPGVVSNYVDHVSKKLGIGAGDLVNTLEPKDLALAMASFEDGKVYSELVNASNNVEDTFNGPPAPIVDVKGYTNMLSKTIPTQNETTISESTTLTKTEGALAEVDKMQLGNSAKEDKPTHSSPPTDTTITSTKHPYESKLVKESSDKLNKLNIELSELSKQPNSDFQSVDRKRLLDIKKKQSDIDLAKESLKQYSNNLKYKIKEDKALKDLANFSFLDSMETGNSTDVYNKRHSTIEKGKGNKFLYRDDIYTLEELRKKLKKDVKIERLDRDTKNTILGKLIKQQK